MEQVQYTDGVTGPNAPADNDGDPGDEHVETPPPAPETEEEPEISDDSTEESEGLNLDRYGSELQEKGTLSEDSFAELEKAGIPKSYVEQYIAGLEAVQNQAAQSMYATVGGEEAYDNMINWASENYSEAEIDAYNAAINQSPEAQKFALESLKARYSAANGGTEPNFVKGSSKKTSAGFRSTAEMVKAMSDPRYKNDPAYRADVENRVKNASF